MTTRIIAVVLAAVLAVIGAVLLVLYVRGADQRAFDGAKLTDVLVVQTAVDAGTAASDLGTSVSVQQVPVAYVAGGAVASVSELAGLVASVPLEPGEQVLSTRFVKPEAFGAAGGRVAVPKGMQEVALSIDVARVVGGTLVAGDTVGVFASLDSVGDSPAQTQLLQSKVLVTAVTFGTVASDNSTPTGSVLVNLALTGDQAERVIYALEFGRVWLSRQSDDVTAPQLGVVTRGAFG